MHKNLTLETNKNLILEMHKQPNYRDAVNAQNPVIRDNQTPFTYQHRSPATYDHRSVYI